MPLEPKDTVEQQSGENSSGQDVYDAAADEIFADDGDGPAQPAATEPESEEADSAADQTPPAEPGEGEAAGNEPDAASEAPPAGQSQDDVWANAPAELREAHQAALRDSDLKYRSAASRQSALDRKLREQQAEIERLKAGMSNTQSNGEAGQATSQSDDEFAKQMQDFREDFPDHAWMADRLEAQDKAIAKLSQSTGVFEQQQAQTFVAQQQAVLAEAHPDWEQLAGDERFAGWLEDQPTALREAFRRNEAQIVDGKDAAFVLTHFKRDLGIGSSQPAQQPNPAAQAQETRRKEQLAANRDARTNSPPVKSGTDKDDYDGTADLLFADD